MAKPFDATLNSLIDLRPGDWADVFARMADIGPGPSTVLDTDLATTLQADKLFRIDGERPSLMHLELEANPRLGIPRDLMRYNTLIDHQHELPVTSVLILLRPKAFASDQTGSYQRHDVKGRLIAEFHYRVEKVWERPVEYWLSAELGVRPLAILTDEASRNLPRGVDALLESIQGRENAAELKALLASAYVLCGLRYDRETITKAFGRLNMLLEDSTTYQSIIAEGIAKGMEKGMAKGMSEGLNRGLSQGITQGLSQGITQGLSQGISQGITQGLSQGITQGLRSTIIRIGTKRFGPPGEPTTERLQHIDDSARLEQLADRILDAGSWDDLLAGG